MTAIPIDSYMNDDEPSLSAHLILFAISAIWGVRKSIAIFKEIDRVKYIRKYKRNSKAKYRVRKRIVSYKTKLRNHITST